MTCVFIFQAGGQCKVLAGLAELVHELLRVFGCVGGDGCIVSWQRGDHADISFGICFSVEMLKSIPSGLVWR